MKIPVTKPYLDNKEKRAVNKVLDSGWLVQGQKVAEFEKQICEFSNSKYACASSSCTTALHMALLALDIRQQDEVIVPSFTYIASVNSIEYTGAKPVFVDIDYSTFNINPVELEKCLAQSSRRKSRIKCIMPVHLFGLCADMDAINDLAKYYNLAVIEDAACSIGSRIGLTHAGTFGDIGCYSFHPRKLITTGEGGILLTGDKEIDSKVRSLRDNGANVSDFSRHKKGDTLMPDFNILGYNYRMTDIQGAIGIEQLRKIQYIIDIRKKLAKIYDDAFSKTSFIVTPIAPDGYEHTYQSYVITIGGREKYDPAKLEELHNIRNNIMIKLSEKGIATRQGTTAVHNLGYYKQKYKYKDSDLPFSFQANQLSMALPIYTQMTEDEQSYVIDILLNIIKSMRL
jgi:perosamine synthetase